VGGEEEIPVDVRILCATNRDLRAEVEAKRFREDLYYRIGVIFVNIPPLRERLEDILLLAEHFVRQCVGQGHGIADIAPEAIAALRQYLWPGNVRELRNVMERAVLLSGGETIGASHCFPQVPLSASGGPERYFDLPLKEASDRFAADYLMRLLAKYGGDTQKVADHAGMHVAHIRRKVRELGIQVRRRRGAE